MRIEESQGVKENQKESWRVNVELSRIKQSQGKPR